MTRTPGLTNLKEAQDSNVEMQLQRIGDVSRPWGDLAPLTSIPDDLTLLVRSHSKPGDPPIWSQFELALNATLEDSLVETEDSFIVVINDPTRPSAAIPAAPPAPPVAAPTGGIRIFDRKNDYFKNLSDTNSTKSKSPSTGASSSTALTLVPSSAKDKDKENKSSGPGFVRLGRVRGTVGLNNLYVPSLWTIPRMQCLTHSHVCQLYAGVIHAL